MHRLSSSPIQTSHELRIITKSIGMLAVLTGLIYLQVIGSESVTAVQSDGIDWNIVTLLILLVVAIGGLLYAWRQEGIGGFVAALSAVGIGILAYFYFPDNRLFSAFAYASPFLITGLMFLACWWNSQR